MKQTLNKKLECDDCRTAEYWPAYNDTSCGYDDEYTRPHRDADIISSMRSWMLLADTEKSKTITDGC